MIKSLTIKNYALIRELKMHPSTHLNTITGETGAGKSIMLGAVGLLLGNRADTKVLYDEEKKCFVEGVFEISELNLQSLFEENDLDHENECIIRREISPSGKSRAFVNDSPVTLDVLKKVGARLVDIHSQTDTLLLGDANYQLSIIDTIAENSDQRKSYKKKYKKFVAIRKQVSELQAQEQQLKNEHDYNSFIYDELKKAAFSENEQQELEHEQQKIEHAEEIKRNLLGSIDVLESSEAAVLSTLTIALKNLQQIGNYSEEYQKLAERLDICAIELKDIAGELNAEEQNIEFDETRAEEVEQRLSLVYQLQKKHGVDSVRDLLLIQRELEQKLDVSSNVEMKLEELQKELLHAEDNMRNAAEELRNSRKSAFPVLKQQIEPLLHGLGMPDAVIEVDLQDKDPDSSGMDSMTILFSANKGIKPESLKSVASGGEFSRLMFAMKFLMAAKTSMPTIIFDEIDTGISGEVAKKMASMMYDMSDNHQVITITHLPQIAAKGFTQFFVYKDKKAEKAVSNIKELLQHEREHEIARMIGGDDPSNAAIQSAKELLIG